MNNLEIVEAELARRVKEQFDLTLAVRLKPVLDKQRGSFTSECAFRVSEVTRTPPELVAAQLLSEPFKSPDTLAHENGFINLTSDSFDYRPFANAPAEAIVILPSQTDSLRGWGYFRLIASGLVQFSLSTKARLLVGKEHYRHSGGRWDYSLIREVLASAFRDIADQPSSYASIKRSIEENQGQGTLWLAPFTFEKRIYKELSSEVLDVFKVARLIILERERFTDIAEKREPRWSDYSDRELGALLLHAASELPGLEFDPSVAKLNEWSNTIYLLAVTFDRLKQFAEVGDGASPIPANAEWRELSFLSATLSLFAERAARDGEVTEFVHALRAYLRGLNVCLNHPRYMTKESRDLLLREILPSAKMNLSAIIQMVFAAPSPI